MSNTRESDALCLSNMDRKSTPVRLRVPKVTISTGEHVPEASESRPATDDSAIHPAPATSTFRLGLRDRSRHLETKSTDGRPANRRGKKWRSRLWVAALALTCLSGTALLFDILNESDPDEADDHIASFENSSDADPALARVATIPANSAVVAADLQTAGSSGTPAVIRPTQYETRSHSTPHGSGPRGALLDGTILFDDAPQVQPSNPHGAH